MLLIKSYNKFLTDFLIKERLLNKDIDGLITVNRKFRTCHGEVEFEKEYQLPYVNIGLKENIESFRPILNSSEKEDFYNKTKRYALTEYNLVLYNKNLYLSDIGIYFGINNDYIIYYLDIDKRYFSNSYHTKNDLCLSLERLKQVVKKMKIST